jgi:hypothetical protein
MKWNKSRTIRVEVVKYSPVASTDLTSCHYFAASAGERERMRQNTSQPRLHLNEIEIVARQAFQFRDTSHAHIQIPQPSAAIYGSRQSNLE